MFDAEYNSGGNRWSLVRVHPGAVVEVILLRGAFLPLTVHWVERSVPCSGQSCCLCAWLPLRGLFYLPVMCMNRVMLLELGAMASAHLEQHCKLLHGGMRPGLVVRLQRRSARAPIHSEVCDERKGVREIGLMDTAAHVMALYQLPGPNVGESFEDYGKRLSVISARRNDMLAKRLAPSKSEVPGVVAVGRNAS